MAEKLVCIDDKFEPWVYDLYKQLPKKGVVYTLREVRPGRSKPEFALDDDAKLRMVAAQPDASILLEELTNDIDPYSSVKQELGFKVERFAPYEEVEEHATTSVEEFVPA